MSLGQFTLDDVENIEAGETSELELYASIQRAINGGLWSLQGSYGRTMMRAIEDGRCLLGTASARDYWGNFIPARDQVQAGTKGSALFVEDNYGAEWREAMEAA